VSASSLRNEVARHHRGLRDGWLLEGSRTPEAKELWTAWALHDAVAHSCIPTTTT